MEPTLLQAYTAGYLEGYVTSEILFMQWQNTVEGYCDWIGENICKKISDYLQENTLWIKKKIHQHRRRTPFHGDHEKYTKYDAHYYDIKTFKNGNPFLPLKYPHFFLSWPSRMSHFDVCLKTYNVRFLTICNK